MKIVLITNLFEPYDRGGAEKIVKTLAEECVKQGHEIFIITVESFRHSPTAGHALLPTREKYTIIRFFPWNFYFVGNDFTYTVVVRFFWHIVDIFNIHSFFKVRSILKKIQPNVVWTHNLMGIGFLIPLAIRSVGLKHIHTLHDVQLAIPSGLLFFGEEKSWKNENIFIKIYTWIVKKLFGSPDLVLSPSHWLMDFYSKREFFAKSKKEVIVNPFDVSQRPSAPSRFARDEKKKIFLFIGQIEEHKGIFFLVDVWKKLNHTGTKFMKNTELIILGDGTQVSRLKKEIAGCIQIQFLGRKSHEDVFRYYQKADYLIFPTLCYENSPNVIQEALLHELPVIASSLGSISEFIEDGKNGFLFPPNNKAKLLEFLTQILEGKKTFPQFSRPKPLTSEKYVKRVFEEIIK